MTAELGQACLLPAKMEGAESMAVRDRASDRQPWWAEATRVMAKGGSRGSRASRWPSGVTRPSSSSALSTYSCFSASSRVSLCVSRESLLLRRSGHALAKQTCSYSQRSLR